MLDLLRTRRSIRRFSDQPIASEYIEQLKEAAVRSPSSRSLNPWEFIFVTETETIARLSGAKQHGSSFLSGAPLAVVVLGDPAQSDVWIEDCSIATWTIQAAAESMGLGACWIQIRRRRSGDGRTSRDYIAERLNIPDNLAVEAVIAIGHPAEEKAPHPYSELPVSKLHQQQYDDR